MNRFLPYGLICAFLLISWGCICIADDAPSKVIYLQGGESIIENISDDLYTITIQDLIPYFQGSSENRNVLAPVAALSALTYPLNAAIIISGPDGDTTSLVEISNASLSEENEVFMLTVKPLKYYEGELLKSFADENIEFNTSTNSISVTGIYIETIGGAPTNNMGCSECESTYCGGEDLNACHHTACCVCCGYACWL